MKLKSRIALISGAGSGFGREVPLQMAREGAKIGVNDVNTSAIEETRKALEGIGAESMALQADVGDVDQVKGMFE